jgi:prepilin-type N-terminal cleavage/methylation domain-containing protein
MRNTERQLGFTLVELMIVVVIIGVLAAVAVGAYSRYTASARRSEVVSMFGEIKNKEESYRAEYSQYLGTSPAAGESDAGLYPPAATLSCRQPQPWGVPAGAWINWNAVAVVGPPPTPGLGARPGKQQLYCSYLVVANPTLNGWGGAGARGKAFFNNVVPGAPWWYALAMCDNDCTPGSLADPINNGNNAVFITSHDNLTVHEENVQR